MPNISIEREGKKSFIISSFTSSTSACAAHVHFINTSSTQQQEDCDTFSLSELLVSWASSSSLRLFLSTSPSCSVWVLCIRQALCGKQRDWSVVIVIIFISPPSLHVFCSRPPAFFFFSSSSWCRLPHRGVGEFHWLTRLSWQPNTWQFTALVGDAALPLSHICSMCIYVYMLNALWHLGDIGAKTNWDWKPAQRDRVVVALGHCTRMARQKNTKININKSIFSVRIDLTFAS